MRTALKTVDQMSAGTPYPTRFAGHDVLLDPGGVAIFPHARLLLVADLHLEKGASFARRRQYLPPYDTRVTLSRLAALVEKHDPLAIITLGDNFHDDRASDHLAADDIAAITSLARGRDLIWITGNHDPTPPRGVPGEAVDHLATDGMTLRHIADRADAGFEISGHWHPCATVPVRGKKLRRPCFASDGKRLILPSFGAFTGGLDIRHPAMAGLFDGDRLCAFLLGEEKVFAVRV